MTFEYLRLDTIRRLQFDHTTNCNLLCSQCGRAVNGQRNSKLPYKELNVEDYKNILSQLVTPLESILFCGNYGDVAASNTFIPSLEYIKSKTSAPITLMTNGSIRPPAWWKQLAEILDSKKDKVCFSIDGLKDTNSIYRTNSHFDKIMQNAQTFIDAGGYARWDYLVFAHNEHQVEEAQALAKKMGFTIFSIKRTSRFLLDNHLIKNMPLTQTGNDDTSTLSPPQSQKFISKAIGQFEDILTEHSTWNNYMQSTPITCKFKKDGTLFIDFASSVWPCTWLAFPAYSHNTENVQERQMQELLGKFDRNFNSLQHHSLNDILQHPWFKELLQKSWSAKSEQRLMTCAKTCGASFDHSASTPSNRNFFHLKEKTL
jgi:MoaA/NifB/PqqE/SkfB family radical SAM enzyme